LADRVEELVAGGAVELVVDVARVEGANVGTVAALARLQVRMRNRGASIRLRGASTDLRAVLELLGLGHALPLVDDD
jgi:ABC-type transporter Mla MlaB component